VRENIGSDVPARRTALTQTTTTMSLAKKLNLKEGMKLRVVGKPKEVDLDDVQTTPSQNAEAVLVFVRTLADVDSAGWAAVSAAKKGQLSWIAYPKAGQLETDLNRDVLWTHLLEQGIQGVRQIAIDDVWSAMRFKPE
jgi:hypothetical protein